MLSADPPRRVGVDVATKLVKPINLAAATLEIVNLQGPRRRDFCAGGMGEGGGEVDRLAKKPLPKASAVCTPKIMKIDTHF